MKTALILFTFLILTGCMQSDPKVYLDDIVLKDETTYSARKTLPLKKLIDSLQVNINKIKVVIDKSDYRLYMYADTMLIKFYPVVFGGNPIDDKLRQGDKCTPEGKFLIRDKYPHAWRSKFLWIDYPNTDSWKKHRLAKEQKLIPANASIGGEVGIHGVPDGGDYMIDEKINWTLGCISLKNADVNEIYPYIQVKKTVIEIRK